MADGKKISELTDINSLTDNDEFLVVNKEVTSGTNAGAGGQTSKITFSDLKTQIGSQGPQGDIGAKGEDGKNAYQIWLDEGNTGSLDEFFASFKGEPGQDGTDGAPGADGADGATGPAGPAGDSGFTMSDDGKLTLGDANVGVGDFGSSSPDATLHIRHERPNLRLTDSLAPGTADFEIANDNDTFFIRTIPGDNILSIKGGNVGISNDAPKTRLHITQPSTTIANADITKGALLVGDDTLGIGIDNNEIYQAGAGLHFGTIITDSQTKNGDAGIIRFNPDQKEAMRITPTGRVGIGTNDPETPLHVKGTTTSGTKILVEATANSGSAEAWLHLKTPTSNYGLYANDLTDQLGIVNYNTSKTPMQIFSNSNVTFEGVVSAKGFSVNGKELTSSDLRGPQGPAGPAGKDGKDGAAGVDGKDGVDGSSTAHIDLKLSSTLEIDATGNQIKKVSGANSWDAHAYSRLRYNSGCVMTFVPNLKNKPAMLGITTDPTANASYNTIDYAWYMHSSGNAYIYENGANKGSFGAFNAGDDFVITYDNNVVRYYLNGVLKRSVTIGGSKTFHFDSSFHSVNSVAYTRSISFHPMGAVGTKGDTGSKGATGETGPRGAAGPSGPVGPQGASGPAGQPVSVTSPVSRWDASSYSSGNTLQAIIGNKPIYLSGVSNYNDDSTLVLDGSRGKVFNFPSREDRDNNYVQAGDVHDDIFTTGNFSISFWVYVRNYKTTTGNSNNLKNNPGAIMSKWYTQNTNGTNNSFIIYSSGQFYSAYSHSHTFANTSDYPKLNDWTHFTYVLNKGQLTVYRNGKSIPLKWHLNPSAGNKTVRHLFNNVSGSYPLEIGSIRKNGAYSLNGMVDDVRIFDEPLTAGEAWFTYNGVGGGGLVGPQGPRGPQGSTGAVGARGPTGPAGPRGVPGPRGSNGNVGPTGPKGATGATGAKGADGKSSFQNYASNTNWELGTSRTTYSANYGDAFTINGSSSENRVEWDIGPFGRRTKIWKARNNDSASNADGGWNKVIKGLDKNKGYMSVTYIKRVSSSTNGQFYHGCGTGSGWTLNVSNNTGNGNPYFSAFGISLLPQNVWCVSVGYIRANNDNSKTNTNGGLYRLDTGAKLRSYTDYKMGTAGIQHHRTYLYYSTSQAASLDWTLPGFYEVCSDSPTLADLIGKTGTSGSKGATGSTGPRGPAGPAGPMPDISQIQNQQFGVLKTNRLDMNGDIEMDRNGSYSRSIKFNSTCNINSSPQNNMHYRATGGKHHFTNGSNGAATIVVDKLETNKFDLSAVSFSGSTSTFKGTSNWSNVTIDGMGAKAWRGNGFYVHRADNKMYAQWTMDGLGSTRFDVHAHSGAGAYKDWKKYIFDNRLMIDTNRVSGSLHSTIRTHRANTDASPNSLHILANHGDLLLEANNIRKGVNQNVASGGHGSVIFRAHGVPNVSHVVDTTNSNHYNYKKQRGDYVYGGTTGANAYNRYRQKHFQGNARSGVSMKLIGGALIPTSGVVDLGAPIHAHRFDTLWCRNAPDVYSDRRAKQNIVETDLGLDFIKKLKPVSYKYKDVKILTEKLKSLDGDEENEDRDKDELEITKESHGRTHYGMIAQDVKKVLDGKDFGGFVDPNYSLDDKDEGKGELHMSLRYEEFISPMIKAIQEVDGKIGDVEKSTNAKKLSNEMNEIRKTQKDILKAIVRLTNRIDAVEKKK